MCAADDERVHRLEWRIIDRQTVLACPFCPFVQWDNPSPVVACLIPILLQPLSWRYRKLPKLFDPDPSMHGIVLVKRGVKPFVGQWCLPCGHINRKENPKAAGRRETDEESGLLVRMRSLINACTPQVEGLDLNELVLIYMAQALGGQLHAGDDALEARIFAPDEMPKLCFSSHQLAVDDWYAGNLGTLRNPNQVTDRDQTPINFALTAHSFVTP